MPASPAEVAMKKLAHFQQLKKLQRVLALPLRTFSLKPIAILGGKGVSGGGSKPIEMF